MKTDLEKFEKDIHAQLLYLLSNAPKIPATNEGFRMVTKAYKDALIQNGLLRETLEKLSFSWEYKLKERISVMTIHGPKEILEKICFEKAPEKFYEDNILIEVKVVIEK